MTKKAALVVSVILLCVGVGAAAGAKHAPATKLAPSIKHEKSLGPKPTPRWYWRWTVWQLGEGYARGHARESALRPRHAPHRIPHWAWRRLHFFVLARRDRAPAIQPKRPPRRPRVAGSGIGVEAYGGNLKSVANLNLYSMVIGSSWSGDTPLLQHAAGRSLTYFDATDVTKSYPTGVTYSEALSHGWLLKSSSGNYLVNSAYGTYCADVGSRGYQQAWIKNVLGYLAAHPGINGVFNDNTIADPKVDCHAYPAKYPSTSAWSAAMLSFVKAAYSALHAHGYYFALNASAYVAGDPASDDGALTAKWWKEVGRYADGLMNENYDETPDGAKRMRTSGPAWYQEWDGWQRLIPTAQSMGKDFIGITYQSCSNTAAMTYAKASFLLGWNGGGSVFIYKCGSSDPTNRAWTTSIGAPAGAKLRVGVGWQRSYTGGTVLVNPSASRSQSFTVKGVRYTLAPTTARILVGS
jgi:putative glycosyl hydrolase-like family 15 (GHL15) protein